MKDFLGSVKAFEWPRQVSILNLTEHALFFINLKIESGQTIQKGSCKENFWKEKISKMKHLHGYGVLHLFFEVLHLFFEKASI